MSEERDKLGEGKAETMKKKGRRKKKNENNCWEIHKKGKKSSNEAISIYQREKRNYGGKKKKKKKMERIKNETTSLAALSALAIMPTAFISASAFSGFLF